MIPVAALLGYWKWGKYLALAGLLIGSFWMGRESALRSVINKQAKQVAVQVVAEQKKGQQAVKQAGSDAKRLSELEKQNEELLKRLDAIIDRVVCKSSADELRILEDIASSTKRN